MMWLLLPAFAQPAPPPAPVIEVVPAFVQGQVHVFLAGREGDQIFIDDFPFGVLPLTTELTEGPHKFRVEGPKGRHVANVDLKIVPDGVAQVDLAPAPAPAPAAP
jgi:hypothetical protein